MSPPAASLRRVSKSYGHGPALVQALQDVDLDIHAGELTLIEGPSGSGKTTLLHLLGLLQRADAGEVWIGDQRMDGLPESRLPDERAAGVALIFQGYNLLDALTAADNVALADLLRRRRAGRSSIRQRAGRSSAPASDPRPSGRAALHAGDASAKPCGTGVSPVSSAAGEMPVPHWEGEASAEPCSAPTSATGGGRYLARFGLAHRAASLPAQLSGGEKQRVAIARALASPGRLVLADEPTANLDWTNAQQVVRYLADLAHAEGRAVVMVSHDSRLEPFADRIVGLLNGQISSDRRQEGQTMPDTDNASSNAAEPRASGRAAPPGSAAFRPRGASGGRGSRRAAECGTAALDCVFRTG